MQRQTIEKSNGVLTTPQWNIQHLKEHLQGAVDLEFWTIPFYMSAMYSIKDKSCEAYQLIRTVVNQEMLHLQCAANIANAYGLSPTFEAPVYGGKIPHIDFSKDNPTTIAQFEPYSTKIGPLDQQRINAMCLIEIPETVAKGKVQLRQNIEEYGSIGEFYEALRYGAAQLQGDIKGGIKQVDFFSAFYRNMPAMTVTQSKEDGFNQVSLLIDLITDQGEGMIISDDHKAVKDHKTIAPTYQNTADDISPEEDHYDKFLKICHGELPEVFEVKSEREYTAHDNKLQQIVIEEFTALRAGLTGLFNGENPDNFFPKMAGVGAAMRNCWEHGVTPKFSKS